MPPDFDIRRIEVIDDETAEMYRRMTPAQRVRTGLEAREFAERVMEAGIRHLNPEWTDAQVHEQVRVRISRDPG